MARERTAICPDCSAERETKAQPRTRLSCRSCGTSYLAPPLNSEPEPDPEPAPEPDAPVEAAGAGVKVVRGGKVNIQPLQPLRPSADPEPGPVPDPEPATEPAPVPDPEPDPEAGPVPDPEPDPPVERRRRGSRGRRPASRWSR